MKYECDKEIHKRFSGKKKITEKQQLQRITNLLTPNLLAYAFIQRKNNVS